MELPLDSCVSRIQVAAAPFVQDKQRPRTRPRSASREKILPDGSDAIRVKQGRQRGTRLSEPGFDARSERPAQPMLPGQGEGAFGLRENLGGQQFAKRFSEERFVRRVPLLDLVRQL